MSVAANFRAKWSVIMNASDASRGQDVDARYATMAKAAEDAGLILISKEMFAANTRPHAMKHPETCPCTDCT